MKLFCFVYICILFANKHNRVIPIAYKKNKLGQKYKYFDSNPETVMLGQDHSKQQLQDQGLEL